MNKLTEQQREAIRRRYVQQSREEMEVLFTLLAERYERGTVMLTSNLPFFEVGDDFQGSDDDGGGD